MNLDFDKIAAVFASDPAVLLVTVFGSARDGVVAPGSDVDVGVLREKPLSSTQFYRWHTDVANRLQDIDELDLVDLNSANSILAFEALCGRRIYVRDADAVAEFVSLVARQYEDDMLHAGHAA